MAWSPHRVARRLSRKRPVRPRSRAGRFESLENRELLAGDLVLTEFMASNDSTLLDVDGNSSDWIEVHNPTASSISLDGWHLTDDAERLDKWTFPAVELGAGEHLVVFASGEDRAAAGQDLVRDLHATADATFVVDLPNGTYDVEVTVGDYLFARDEMVLSLQGDQVDTLLVGAGRFLVRSYTAQVSGDRNGQLALRLQDLGGVTGRAVINGLVITPRGAGDPKRFDFGETDSPVAAGYDQVTESDAYSALAGYGWQAGDVTDQDRRFPELHTNFKLSSGGEYLGLVGPDGTVAQDFGVEYPPQVTDVSFGIPAGGSAAVFLATPTPGGPNSRARSAQVLFDRESGVFDSPFPLSLSVDAPGATIHYTTDGTVPTESSPVYTGPITIDLPVNVQAIAIAPQSATSAVTSAWFMKMGSDLANFSSDLPIVALDNFASPPRAGVFRFSALTIFEPDEVTGRSGLFAPPDLVTRSGIKVRGSSTAGREKASYAFEAWDDQDRDKDISPLGLPSESDWILYGPYDFDLALMRNAFIFELSNQVGRWAPRTRFVEVFFNRDGGELSADDYRGVYVLMEKIKRGPDRVDIANLTPADNSEPEISGGWILKQDRADGDRGFGTDSGRTILYVDPKEVEVTPEQAVWIKNDFDRMFASLSDTNPETGYEQTIDVDSWIDHSILNVLPMNVDAYRLSAFFYKDRGGKYEMGPIWDFDRTMGSEDGRDARIDAWSGTGDSSRFFEDNVQYPWWGILEDDPNYMQRWIDRWFELRETVLSEENIDQIIDSMAAELEEAQGRNYERWSDLRLNGGDFAEPNAQTWWGEVRHLKGWLHARLAWIDSQFPPRPTVSPGAGRIPIGQRIQLSADSGTVYFTTDGSDPRLPGGGVNPSAIAAEPTVQLIFAGSLHVVARTERDGQWSPMLETRFFIAGVPDDATELSISEINYAPHAPTAAERAIDPGLNRGDFEFIEIVNQGDHTIDLEGVRFSDGIEFTFGGSGPVSLSPGQIGLVVRDRDTFEIRYGSGLPVLGEFESGRLNDDGEPIQLEDRFGVVVEQFAYGDAGDWPGRADGLGSSLERIDPEGGHEPANWRASTEYGGSPGAPGSGPVQTATINEVLTASGGADRIELVNSTDHPIDISAWYLSDQIDDLFKFRIPDSTTLAAGQYVVLDESQTGLALDAARAGQLWLMSVDAEGGAIRFADDARFDAAEPGVSLGRWPDGQVNGSLLPMASQTFGQPNSGPLVGPVIVSEVHYNPPEFPVIDKTFDDGTAGGFQPVLGDWTVTDGRYSVMPNDDSPIGDTVAILPEIGVLSSSFRIDATVEIRTDSGAKKNAMIVFDYRSPTDFKFVSLHATVNKLKIGQRDDTGWNFLNVVQLPGVQLLNTDVLLSVEVAGSVARLRLNGAAELTHDFGSPPRGGQVGLATKNGAALFDRVTVHRRNSQEFEFVELLNTTADTLDVSGWQLTGEIAVTLPEGTSLDAGSTLVVVPFDPRIEAVAEDFRRRYGIDQSVALAGPPTGTLDNDTATLRLMRPLGSGGGGLVLVDEVGYDTEPPWPAAADGGGASLGRRSVDARGTVPAGWSGQVPNPGSVVMAEAGDLDGNGKVDAGDIEALVLALRNPTAYEAAYGMPTTVAGDIDQDGDVDFDDIAGFLEILLGSSTPASAGTEPVITEFMASNAFSLVDQDGTTSTVGATIHYTLDGSKPTPTEGTVYTGPLTIDTTSTLRAVAFKDEFLQTDVGTQTYIFPDQRV